MDSRQACDHAGRRRSAPLFIHAMGRVQSKLEERFRIGQQLDALASGEASLTVLVLDVPVAAALADRLALVAHL